MVGSLFSSTVLVCVLKLQNGWVALLIHRLEDVQEKPRDAMGHTREVKTEGEHRRYDTSSVGRGAFLYSEQLYGKITFVFSYWSVPSDSRS